MSRGVPNDMGADIGATSAGPLPTAAQDNQQTAELRRRRLWQAPGKVVEGLVVVALDASLVRAVLPGHRRAVRGGGLLLLWAADFLSPSLVAHGPAGCQKLRHHLHASNQPKNSRLKCHDYTLRGSRPSHCWLTADRRGRVRRPMQPGVSCQVHSRSTTLDPAW